MSPQGGDPINPADAFFVRKYGGVQKPSGNPADDFYNRKYGSHLQQPEEDLPPADESTISYINRIGEHALTAGAYGLRDLMMLPGTGAKPYAIGQRIYDAVKFGKNLIADKIAGRASDTMAKDAETPGLLDTIKTEAGRLIGEPDLFVQDMVKGIGGGFVEPVITAASGMKSTTDGLVPASPAEQYKAIAYTAANAAMLGTYSAVSSTIKMGATASRAGNLAKALGAEAAANVAGGIAGSLVTSAITNEDITLKNIAMMVVSPPALIFTALGAKHRFGAMQEAQSLTEFRRSRSMVLSHEEYKAANSLAANANSTEAEITSSMASIAKSDNLTQAAINANLKIGNGYLQEGVDDATYKTIVGHYKFADPSRNPPPDLNVKPPNNKKIDFASNFDALSYKLGSAKLSDNGRANVLKELVKKTGLDEEALMSHAQFMQKVVKDQIAPPEGKMQIPTQQIQPYFGREALNPNIYRGPNGEVYFSGQPLSKATEAHFKATGFMPQEIVSVLGKDAILQKVSPTYSMVDFGLGPKRVKTSNIVRKLNTSLEHQPINFGSRVVDTPDTRGKGTQYHGARGPIKNLNEGYYNDANIYGGEDSFYTTDALDISEGYRRKSPNGVVYKITERPGLKLFDMEEAKPASHWEERFAPQQSDLIGSAIDQLKGKSFNLRELMDEMRALSRDEMLSRNDVQDIFGSMNESLAQEGYSGMTHIGGLQSGKPPHKVNIYFNPAKNIGLEQHFNKIEPIGGIQLGQLNPESYLNKNYAEFRASIDNLGDKSWQENFYEHLSKTNIPISEYPRVQQYYYKKLNAEATLDPHDAEIVNFAKESLETSYNKNVADIHANTIDLAFSNGFYFNLDSQGYVLRDVRTSKPIGTFATVSRMNEFIARTGQGESIYLDGGGTGGGDPAIAMMPHQLPSSVETGVVKYGNFLLPARKSLEFSDILAGTSGNGARMAYLTTGGAKKYGAYAVNEALTLKQLAEEVIKLDLPEAHSTSVARMLQARGIDALRADLTPEQVQWAHDNYANAPIDATLEVIRNRVALDESAYKDWVKHIKPDAKVVSAADNLYDTLNKSEDSAKIIRYMKALENPELAMTSDQLRSKLIADGLWSPKAELAYRTSKAYFKEGARLNNIPEEDFINNYLPTIIDFNNAPGRIPNRWVKNGEVNSQFIHELTRMGWTPDPYKLMNIEDILHKYFVSTVRVRSGMLDMIKQADDIKTKWTEELKYGTTEQKALGNKIATDWDTWVSSIKGVPSPEDTFLRAKKSNLPKSIDTVMDWMAIKFLAGRPVMLAQDGLNLYAHTTSKYGVKAFLDAVTVKDFGSKIEKAQARGETPQFEMSSILARGGGGKTALSGIVDWGLKWSGQELAYKQTFGRIYISTKERVLELSNIYSNNHARIYRELGDLLEGNNAANIKTFKEYLVNNPNDAAQYLGTVNASAIANEYGKINNPLNWQTSNGRLAGQFGSWAANATSSQLEMYAGKDWKYIRRAAARQIATGTSILIMGKALGIDPSKFIISPLTTIPGLSPIVTMLGDISKIANGIATTDEDKFTYLLQQAKNLAINTGTPNFVDNAYQSYVYLTEYNEQYKALMKGLGFKIVE